MYNFGVVKIIQAGGVAAPICSQVLGEVLPYLNIEKTVDEEENEIEVPKVEGLSIKEARQVLKDANLLLEVEENNNNSQKEEQENQENAIIKNQSPKPGIRLLEGKAVRVEL